MECNVQVACDLHLGICSGVGVGTWWLMKHFSLAVRIFLARWFQDGFIGLTKGGGQKQHQNPVKT